MEEHGTAELRANSGGQQCSVEHARARRREPDNGDSTATVFLQEKGERRRMSASRSSRTMLWRSCVPSTLMSGAWSDVRTPNGGQMLPPVGHVDDDGFHSELDLVTDKATLA